MSDLGFAVGVRLANGRYRVVEPASAQGEHLIQRCVVEALPIGGGPDERFEVLLKMVHYGRRLPNDPEPLGSYVKRRRAMLEREAQNLARCKRLSNHVPQVVDLLHVTNDWSYQLVALGLQAGEPVLVLEELAATPLAECSDLPQDEALELAERLLMLLRVFHRGERAGDERFFYGITPREILLDRATRTCWLSGLDKLRMPRELQTEGIHCPREEQVFVSPALARFLVPQPAVQPASVQDPSLASTDLYSLGVCLVRALLPADVDFSNEPVGFTTRDRMQQLLQTRPLVQVLATFLGELLEHKFKTAQAALERLCQLRRRPHPGLFDPPSLPVPREFPDVALLPLNVLVGGRYLPIAGLSVGGQGCVYIAMDQHTGCPVVLKAPHYKPDQLATPQAITIEVPEVRNDILKEARRALQTRRRTGSVPQLLDVVYAPSPEPKLRSHGNPDLSQREPILVFEDVAGHPLSVGKVFDERFLLHLLRVMCAVLIRMHEEQHGCSLLYIDWKVENVLWHPETDGFTLLDLGSVVVRERGEIQVAELARTEPYAALEDMIPAPGGGQTVNRRLAPSFDLYGLGAVVWRLAVRPDDVAWKALGDRRKHLADTAQVECVFDPAALPAGYDGLRPILERILQPDPGRRIATAAELLAEVLAALGRASELTPERPRNLTGTPLPGHGVELVCTLAADPLARKVLVFRVAPPAAALLVHESSLAGGKADKVRCKDLPPDTEIEARYEACVDGHNGQRSSSAGCTVRLVVDPVVQAPERRERSVCLRWTVPDLVRRALGEVVVQCRTGVVREVYRGNAAECVDAGLDPAVRYQYRVFTRSTVQGAVVESPGASVLVAPLPILARVETMEALPGDRRVSLRFTLAPGAADAVQVVRSEAPQDDRACVASAQTRGEWLPLAMERFQVRGAMTPGLSVTTTADGRVTAVWQDPEPARAGRPLCYRLVLRYQDGAQTWPGPECVVTPFAEVGGLVARPMPRGVRLEWQAPAEAEQVLIQRDGVVDPVVLPGTVMALFERNLLPGTPCRYRVQLRTGAVVSPGLVIDAMPDAATAPPPLPAVSLGNGNGGASGPGAVHVLREPPATLLASWSADAASVPHLVLVDGAPLAAVTPPGSASCKFTPLPPGPHRVGVYAVTDTGELSVGAVSPAVAG